MSDQERLVLEAIGNVASALSEGLPASCDQELDRLATNVSDVAEGLNAIADAINNLANEVSKHG